MKITEQEISKFKEYLIGEELAAATVRKYTSDVAGLMRWLDDRAITKQLVMEYKDILRSQYAPTSVNAAIASLNKFFLYTSRADLKIKYVKMQRSIFGSSNEELSREDCRKLIEAARQQGKERLCYIMQTIFVTGIRISELKYITVEAIECGVAYIDCKGKMREVYIPKDMCRILKKYINSIGIKSGSIFITRSGRPVDRSNVHKSMKRIAECASVGKKKVFPHNLRHLFARTYYSRYKDIVRLADILGHSSVNTTRIYTRESGDTHRRQIEQLKLMI